MAADISKPRWLWLPAVLTAAWLVLPALVVVPMSLTETRSFRFPPTSFSLRWYEEFFTNPVWIGSLQASISIAVQTTILSVLIGTAAAFGIVRGRFPGKRLIEVFGLAPLIVPIVVFGLGSYALFLRWGLVGTPLGFVAAHTVLAVPYVIVTVSAALRVLNTDMERAAAVLGANPLQTFLRITLPAIRGGVVAGALFSFVTSFDEVVVSLFISNPRLRTLPVEMYSSVTRDINPTIAAASTLILILSVVLILLSTTLTVRSTKTRRG